MTAILKQFQATPPPAFDKAVEETYVTCGGAHPYYQCLAAGATLSQNSGIISKDTFQQPQLITIRTSLSNQTNEIKNMMASLLQMNTASTSGSGSLPSNTVANLRVNSKPSPLVVDLLLMDLPFPLLPNPLIRSELKCKALAYLGASINLMPLSVWKKLGLPKLISTRMTLELANRAVCTPSGIARDVFVPVGKFTFSADFVIVDYESDPRVPLILGRPFLQTAHALIDVLGEEMILFNNDNPLSGSTTFSSNPLLEEFADELAFPSKYDDDLQFDIESDLKEIEFMLHQDIDSCLKDSIDLANPADKVIDSDFSKVDAFPSTNNEDKIFNPGILIQEKYFEIITRVVQDKKLASSNASLVLEDFDPPFHEPLFFKEVSSSKMLLPFSFENEEKVFKPGFLLLFFNSSAKFWQWHLFSSGSGKQSLLAVKTYTTSGNS
nr:reverse transcriptase domain-containing protein [Tanacetum cinerariifolium]